MVSVPNFDKFEPLITKIRKLFEIGLQEIRGELAGQTLSDWNTARKKQIERQVSNTLRILRDGSVDLAGVLTRASYEDGLAILDGTGKQVWDKIHNGRINEIAREFQRSLTDGVAEVGRWVDDGLRRIQLDAAMKSQIQGLSIDESKTLITKYIQDEGLSMPRGYKGDIGSYAEMVARTNLAEANRAARMARASERGVTLFVVKHGYEPCESCAAWEGGIISMFPNADGIPDYETIRTSRKTHLFGPNCRHERLTPVISTMFSEEQIQGGIEISKSAAAKFGI